MKVSLRDTHGLRILWTSLTAILASAVQGAAADPAQHSPLTSGLWGVAGERWESGGRLTDFSYAGYHRGERALPDLRPAVSVRDFGAVGDGTTDDTDAFQRALREAQGKVIAIPPGRYVVTDILEVKQSGTVLQGAGPDQTVLYAPKPLEHIRSNMGATTDGRPTSNYSWSGGMISARGRWNDSREATVTAPAQRGERSLAVEDPLSFQTGEFVRLVLFDDADHQLTDHLYAGDPGEIDNLRNVRASWIARIVGHDSATRRLMFDRPLRTDVRLEWTPKLSVASTTIEEIGIENLAIEFPITPYAGHFTEVGYNAIAFRDVRNSWIRNVEIRHADSGIFLGGANNTVTDIVWRSQRQRGANRHSTGHHGITLGGTDQLLSGFQFRTKFIHDITVSRGSAGNVARDGQAEDLTFDHHKYANHANLFTNIDAGIGTNIFRSGGGAKLGRHCGGWTTWWNIRTQQPIAFPSGWATDWINIVGVDSNSPPSRSPLGRWFEPIPPDRLQPADLYAAQRQRRLGPVAH